MIRLNLDNLRKFGSERWIDDSELEDFQNDAFPQYMTEI